MREEGVAAARCLVFEFSLPLNLSNCRVHWRDKHRKKVEFWDLCDNRVLARLNPPKPESPLVAVEAEVTVRTYRACDPDGALARTKWAWDWLTTRGYLVDDSSRVLTITRLMCQTVRKHQVGMKIALRDVAARPLEVAS